MDDPFVNKTSADVSVTLPPVTRIAKTTENYHHSKVQSETGVLIHCKVGFRKKKTFSDIILISNLT